MDTTISPPKARGVWLNRQPGPALPYLALATSQEEFEVLLKDIDIVPDSRYVNPGAHATTWEFVQGTNVACVVSIDAAGQSDPIEIAALLVHEAVHVWQTYRDRMLCEKSPSSEQEAYAIQFISGELMRQFARTLKETPDA